MYFLQCEICYIDFYVSGWENHLFRVLLSVFREKQSDHMVNTLRTKDKRTGTELNCSTE